MYGKRTSSKGEASQPHREAHKNVPHKILYREQRRGPDQPIVAKTPRAPQLPYSRKLNKVDSHCETYRQLPIESVATA